MTIYRMNTLKLKYKQKTQKVLIEVIRLGSIGVVLAKIQKQLLQ